ncbi:hypothetical protein SEA_KEANU_53 [Streptomyces phage Keanu]|nr:hypothetical protein SEA_KEANU_53 [Streptomyces phage Keanu]
MSNLDQLLDQADVWVDKNEVTHQIETMDGRYALNVYNWLKSRSMQIGFRYGLHLAGMRLPDEDTVAYLHVTEAIDREQERIADDSEAWIKDKPLMRALIARVAVDRITKDQAGYVPPTSPLPAKFVRYEAKAFQVPPPGDLDEETYGQRPGDETKVFLVIEPGDYDCSDEVVAVFVGNRLAAYRYEVEGNRYAAGLGVTEFDDNNAGKTEGMYGQIRRYHDAWTEVEYKTIVNLETAAVVTDYDPVTCVRNSVIPGIETTKEADGLRGRYNVVIKTTGPDSQIEKLRAAHSNHINTIRANVLADVTKDMP